MTGLTPQAQPPMDDSPGAPPPPQPALFAVGGGVGSRRDRRATFPKIVHSVWGEGQRQSYLRLSQTLGATWSDMRAVCGRHQTCSLSKSCRSQRPIGWLWAWLNHGSEDGCVTKADHKAYVPTWEERQEARNEFMGIDGVDDWFAAEPEAPGGELEETR